MASNSPTVQHIGTCRACLESDRDLSDFDLCLHCLPEDPKHAKRLSDLIADVDGYKETAA